MPCSLELKVETIEFDTVANVEVVCDELILNIEDSVCPIAIVEISPTPNNIIEQLPDGLYVPPSVAAWGTTDW